jgi:energy-coupling factor transport system ATP-binding protein
MARRELISGPNFSGRSAALMALLHDAAFAPECFYIGPYSEAALSGLTSTIADEIELYRAKSFDMPAPLDRAPFTPFDVAAFSRREPQTLSGGEQVLLALHCFSLSNCPALAIDTALEQLDPANRDAALGYFDRRRGLAADVALIDNRLPPPLVGWTATERAADTCEFACDPRQVVADLRPRQAPTISIRGLTFGYRHGSTIFRDVDLALTGGTAYRLAGPNGAGKTTLLKLLVGVLAPNAGELTLGNKPYRPWRHGNRAIALATQNPDHQWSGATLADDLARRRAAFAGLVARDCFDETRLQGLAAALGAPSLDTHLYELPLAARKRLSWLWPLAGALPWAVLDEPSLGQDLATRVQLAAAIARLTELGYGVLFVTHDDDFAARIPHRVLAIGDGQVKAISENLA